MTTTYNFEQERFKPCVMSFLNSNYDFNSIHMQLRRPMRLAVFDIIPSVWLSDGHHYMETLFTKDAVNEFRKNYSNIKLSGLKDKMLFIQKWSLQIKQ